MRRASRFKFLHLSKMLLVTMIMKCNSFLLMLPLLALPIGCNKAGQDDVSAQHAPRSKKNKFPEPTLVETTDGKERREIRETVLGLLGAGKYDELDRMAEGLRRSKACFCDGFWKLSTFYSPLSDLPYDSSDSVWTSRLGQLRLWMDQKPDSITAPVALAETLRNYAWKARGGGWAGEVTETGWKLFHERLAECAKVLGIGA